MQRCFAEMRRCLEKSRPTRSYPSHPNCVHKKEDEKRIKQSARSLLHVPAGDLHRVHRNVVQARAEWLVHQSDLPGAVAAVGVAEDEAGRRHGEHRGRQVGGRKAQRRILPEQSCCKHRERLKTPLQQQEKKVTSAPSCACSSTMFCDVTFPVHSLFLGQASWRLRMQQGSYLQHANCCQ